MMKIQSQTILLLVFTALFTWLMSSIICQYHVTFLLLDNDVVKRNIDAFSSDPSSKDSEKNEGIHKRDGFVQPKKVWVDTNRYDGISRVYKPWNFSANPFPCYLGRETLMTTTPASEGLLFQTPEKTGTTTMVGVLMRLAKNRGEAILEIQQLRNPPNQNTKPYCKHRAMHGTARDLQYDKRDRNKSFLFSLIRDPTAMAVSRYFHFRVSVYQHDPTDQDFLNELRSTDNMRPYLRDLSTNPNITFIKDQNKSHTMIPVNYTSVVQGILDDYDFIGITERMDESLIVMKLLLNLTMEEILYLKPARSSGSFSNGFPDRPCVYLVPSFLTPGIMRYLESPEWKRRIEGDELLYTATYKSLDRTIDALGRVKVERTLGRFRKVQAYAQDKCEGKVVGMCDEAGKPVPIENRTCIIWSEGCDHVCLNSLQIPQELLQEADE